MIDERDSARNVFYKGADRGDPMPWRDIGPDELWNAAWDAATKAERDACAGICDALESLDYCVDVRYAADAIRARSH